MDGIEILREIRRIDKELLVVVLTGYETVETAVEAKSLLTQYSWPGNVRELKNVVESAVLLADEIILPHHLPLKIQDASERNVSFSRSLKKVARGDKENVEKEAIKKILKEVHWNKSKASRLLDIDYKTLYNKIREYNIERI